MEKFSKNVLVPEKLDADCERILEDKVYVLRCAGIDERSLCEAVPEADGIVLRSGARITEAVLSAAPRLRAVSRTGAGVDNVDVGACTLRGVAVCYLPGLNAYAVAEHTMALMLALLKFLPMMDRSVRNGEWSARNKNLPQDARGKTLGILGLGRIGREVAARAKPFGMEIIGYDPYVKQADGVTWREADEVFALADILTLHLPETEQTRHFVNAGKLAMMKPSAYLINASRGGVADEAALIRALKNRTIAGAALDVLENEPPSVNNELLGMDNVILTPHTAALTEQCGAAMTREAVEQLLTVLDGGRPPHIANPEVLKRL
jgi:D-3-phosphoglycerate dehydrogenase